MNSYHYLLIDFFIASLNRCKRNILINVNDVRKILKTLDIFELQPEILCKVNLMPTHGIAI